ncbi:MAG: 50S ribosomal protein L18e [Thermoplasmata archaeon]|nr:50S ribosomal protein L18e [Thermoplasmata archaeon]
MLREIRKENPELSHTLIELRRAAKAHDAPIWGDVARRLARPRHQVEPVNVGQLERLASANDTVVVPGKLLAQGVLSKPLTVAAFHYSDAARDKVHRAGGTTLGIHELIKAKPTGAGVRIIA